MPSFANASPDLPDLQTIRNNAILAGGVDPISLRFRVIEYEKSSGERLGVPVENVGFTDAVHATMELIRNSDDSEFCLEPVGFIQ